MKQYVTGEQKGVLRRLKTHTTNHDVSKSTAILFSYTHSVVNKIEKPSSKPSIHFKSPSVKLSV